MTSHFERMLECFRSPNRSIPHTGQAEVPIPDKPQIPMNQQTTETEISEHEAEAFSLAEDLRLL